MIRITEDLTSGAKYTLDRTGQTLVRLLEVSGLTPGLNMLAQAVVAQDSITGEQMPAYAQAHPSISGLFVVSIEADPIAAMPASVLVKVKYASPEASSVFDAVKITLTGSSRAKMISNDPVTGNPLLVKYTDGSGTVLQQFLQVPVLSPNTILEFTRQELTSPMANSQTYRRTVNTNPWQNGAAKTWLCRAINATSLNNLTRYEVKYIFEYDPDGWQRLEYFHDPYTGKIPDDVAVSTGNDQGVAKILPYGTADFSGLGLPNAF